MEVEPNTTRLGFFRKVNPAEEEMEGMVKAKEVDQENIKKFGKEIFSYAESAPAKGGFFRKDWWYGRIMEWSMQNEDFKTRMFRFVDVLPTLTSPSEVTKHIKEYFNDLQGDGVDIAKVFNLSVGVGALAPGLMAKAIRKNVQQMAKMFITGEDPKSALPILKKQRDNNICFTVDLLGEATLSEKEALDYHQRYTEIIKWLSKDAKSWATKDLLDSDALGEIPKVNVSVKLTSVYSQVNEKDWEGSVETLKDRLRSIFRLAIGKDVFINIDMESFHHKDMTFEVFKQLLLEEEFKSYPHFGIVLQAYLRDSYADLQELIAFADHRGTPFSVRLVKGAYWDYENIVTSQKDWPIPVYTNKQESDANYEQCAKLLLDHFPKIKVALASHNVRSLAASACYAEHIGLPKNAFEIQMLYGMADELKSAFVKKGYRVREYATVGDLIPGMAYLVRRLLENTSNESFLRSKFVEGAELEKLMTDPAVNLSVTTPEHNIEKDFHNEAPLDFTESEPRTKMQNALIEWKKKLGQTYPLYIQNKPITTDKTLPRENPSKKDEIVGQVCLAGYVESEQALEAAKEAFPAWKATPPEQRAELVDRLADLILRDRYELCALEVLEVGKTWSEADGDIIEAIDFCRYYAKEMRLLAQPQRIGKVLGETSHYVYDPRGVSLVIAPWNFPLAILTGMVSASLVTGNTVIMKPAEQSSIVAHELMKLIMEAGFPAGTVQYLPGLGEEVGEFLSNHKDVDLIAFTGSKQVGLKIIEKSGKVHTGQKNVKRCIVEMGGKNALIIDNDADLDEAVASTVYSAFGFQGQKCSACSRVIVLEEVYDMFVDRLVEATKSIKQSSSENPSAYLGPVVDQTSMDKILHYVERARSYAKVAYQGNRIEGGYFVPPTIVVDVKPNDEIAQTELFGPVLSVIKVKDIDEAIAVANNTEYGLTGGLFSRSPGNIEQVKNRLEVGNLYINRSITGAIVDRHPFGGFKMSGVGSKTGGPDYLKQFLEPRVITENTMRRGFAPAE